MRVVGLAGAVVLVIAMVFGFSAAEESPPRVFEMRVTERAPVLGVVVDDGFQVLEVEEGSAAARAGLRRGDVIARLGDETPASPTAAKQLVRTFREGATVPIAVRRAGRQLTVPVPLTRPTGRPGAPTPTAVPQQQMYL